MKWTAWRMPGSEAGTCVERAIQLLEHPDESPENPPEVKQPLLNKDDAVQDYMPKDPDTDLIGEFVAEANDLISRAEEALLSLEVDPEDMDAVGTVFRAFHTIKGTSAFLELSLLSEMGHHAESLLSRVRDKEIRYQGGYADLALRSLDMLKTLMHSVEKALGGDPLMKPEGYDALMEALMNPEAAGVSEEMDDRGFPADRGYSGCSGKGRPTVDRSAGSGSFARSAWIGGNQNRNCIGKRCGACPSHPGAHEGLHQAICRNIGPGQYGSPGPID